MIETALLAMALWGASPVIDVVYPRIMPPDTIARIDRVDSNFVFGSVQPSDAKLWINGAPATVHPNGAFLVFLPVDWKRGLYEITAKDGRKETKVTVRFAAKPKGVEPKKPQGGYPRILELSSTPVRTDPKGTYYLFPSSGVKVEATGWSNGYYQIPLAPGRSGWVDAGSARVIGEESPPPQAIVHQITVDTLDGDAVLIIPSERKLLLDIRDEGDPERVRLSLFSAVSRINRIRYSPLAPLVKEIYWDQPADGVLSLDVQLTAPLWGYYGVWSDKAYTLHLRVAPKLTGGLNGLVIAIDAGHGGDQDGAIGPMRTKEKDVNLLCAFALEKKLKALGARAVMIRTTDSAIGLNQRVSAAEAAGAHLLISLHHNALPDGMNPFGPGPFGVSAHYYRSQSREFALAVKEETVKTLQLPDEGIYYDDLALVRPSYMPAVLLEAAYIMFPEQEGIIASPDYPERLAEAIARGVERYVEGRLR